MSNDRIDLTHAIVHLLSIVLVATFFRGRMSRGGGGTILDILDILLIWSGSVLLGLVRFLVLCKALFTAWLEER